MHNAHSKLSWLDICNIKICILLYYASGPFEKHSRIHDSTRKKITDIEEPSSAEVKVLFMKHNLHKLAKTVVIQAQFDILYSSKFKSTWFGYPSKAKDSDKTDSY